MHTLLFRRHLALALPELPRAIRVLSSLSSLSRAQSKKIQPVASRRVLHVPKLVSAKAVLRSPKNPAKLGGGEGDVVEIGGKERARRSEDGVVLEAMDCG